MEKDKCPKCGSKKIIVHSGMFIDLYECSDCHYEWR